MVTETDRLILGDYCDELHCDNCPLDVVEGAWCKKYNHMNAPDALVEKLLITFGLRSDTTKPESTVDHPSHYNQGGIECLDAMMAAYGKEATATFCLTNAFKYIWRTEHKNGIQDIDKAIWYLNKYKELKSSE